MRLSTSLFVTALLVAQAVLSLGSPALALADPAAEGPAAATPAAATEDTPRAENPFREGTERVPLTPEERELLLEYTANSLNKLSRALDRAARQSEEEAYSTYVTAIIDVVIHSYRYKGRDELLMRVALNQGLALAYGVPSSDGKGVEVSAVLARARMQRGAVFNRILKDTIELALKYLKQDQAGIKQGELSRLPYFELALERLRKLREWLPSVFEQEVQYALILAGLEQFQSSVNHVTHQERLKHAQAMVGIDTILKEYPRDARPSEILWNPRLVRQLRVDFFEVARELVGKTERELHEKREQERKERERIERERAEQERAERERAEAERERELERVERERIIRERAEQAREVFQHAREQLAVEREQERARAERERVERERAQRFMANLNLSFVSLQPGTFWMGSPEKEYGRDRDEQLHQVTLTKGFEIQTTEVTQRQWFEVMGTNPSTFTYATGCPSQRQVIKGVTLCPNHPVEHVSWEDVSEFIQVLNSKTNDGYTYRLPTEAEWEYAARAGTTTPYSFGNWGNQPREYVSHFGSSDLQTHAVAQKKPNPWGLYDIHGNVWEWVSDWYGDYSNAKQVDPQGALSGTGRVIRGGSWYTYVAGAVRSAERRAHPPSDRDSEIGLRLVRTR